MSRNKILFISLFLLLLSVPALVSAQDRDLETIAREKAHHRNPGFFNSWLPPGQTGNLLRFLTWKFDSNPYAEEKKYPPAIPFIAPPVDDILKRGYSGDTIPNVSQGKRDNRYYVPGIPCPRNTDGATPFRSSRSGSWIFRR